MAFATRDAFLGTREREYGTVNTNIGVVRFQSITEGERVRIMDTFIENKQTGAAETAHVIALSVVDDEGNRLFRDDEIDHILDMNSQLIRTIYEAIDDRFGVKSTKEQERTEAAAKNLQTTSGVDSLYD